MLGETKAHDVYLVCTLGTVSCSMCTRQGRQSTRACREADMSDWQANIVDRTRRLTLCHYAPRELQKIGGT